MRMAGAGAKPGDGRAADAVDMARPSPSPVMYKIPEVMAMLRMSRHAVYAQIRRAGCGLSRKAAPPSSPQRPSPPTSSCWNAKPKRAADDRDQSSPGPPGRLRPGPAAGAGRTHDLQAKPRCHLPAGQLALAARRRVAHRRRDLHGAEISAARSTGGAPAAPDHGANRSAATARCVHGEAGSTTQNARRWPGWRRLSAQ